jgi:hypothetical protein
VILAINPKALRVSLRQLINEQLRPKPNEVVLISDAGPFDIGMAIFNMDGETCIAHTAVHLPFDAGDPAFQNSREFMGLVLGTLLSKQWIRNRHPEQYDQAWALHWIGDNRSALRWAEQKRCKSAHTQQAFMAFTWLNLIGNIQSVSTTHRAGILMGDIDRLSRRQKLQVLDPALHVNLQHHQEVQHLLQLIDPTLLANSNTKNHHQAFTDIHDIMMLLLQQA